LVPSIDAPKTIVGQALSKPLDFVCEDDVRQALRHGQKIVVGDRTIVTPQRDLAEQHHLFVQST
jgi:hypothetical protein